MEQTNAILAKCESAHLIGDRAASDRPIIKHLKKIAQKGVLSLLLLAASAQALAGAPTPPSMPDQPLPQASMVIEQATAKFVDTNFTQAADRLDWVSAQGNVDGAGMLQVWRDGDVGPNNILELTKVMIATQSPTIARTEAAELEAIRLSAETRGIFDIHTDAQAAEFLKTHSLDAMAERGVLSSDVAFIYGTAASEDITDTALMWNNIATNHNTVVESSVHANENDSGMAEAKQQLLNAVDQAGLASVTVPLPYWGSSEQIKELATNIASANQELQQVTGWEGPVLGLNGRVALTVGQPFDKAVAFVDSQEGSPPRIAVHGSWEYVGHELTHAWDMAMRIDAGLPGVHDDHTGEAHRSSTLTEVMTSESVPESIKNSYSAWGNLNADLKEAGLAMATPWHLEMQKKADGYTGDTVNAKWLNSYYQRAQEQIAYSFSAHVDHVLQGVENSTLGGAAINHNGERTPSLEEAAVAAPVWSAALKEANQNWWAPQLNARLSANGPALHSQDPTHYRSPQSAEQASTASEAVAIPKMGSFGLRLTTRRAEGVEAVVAPQVKMSQSRSP